MQNANNDKKTQMLKANQRAAMSLAPEHPWNHYDPEKLGPCITNYIEQHEPYFRRWAENWFMAMVFVFGEHNFRWSKRHGFAVDFDQARARQPSNYIRAYTNIARIAIEALTASLYANMPAWDVETMEESATAGRRQKKIVGNLLSGFGQTLQTDKDYSAAAYIFAMFGQMAFEAGWDPMAGKVIEIPKYLKAEGQAYTSWMAPNPATGGMIEVPTPAMGVGGRPYLEDNWQPAKDASGRQIVDKVFTGNPFQGVLTPFEYRRTVGSIGMHKTRSVQIFRLLDYDKWLDTYGQLDGKTKFYTQVQPSYMTPSVYQFAFRLFMRLMYVTPPGQEDSRWGMGINGTLQHKVLVVEHYDEPHPLKWPEGRRVVTANGACTHITKPQYNTGKLDGWHPLSEAQWMNCYPSSIASGPMQDIVKKNHELNVMDSFIATASRRNLASQLLVKIGSGIDPNRFLGQPGIAHEVTDPYGARYLHDEMPIPPVVAQIRQQLMDDAYKQAGAMDAMRGTTDDKATSGYQAKINEEREEKRMSPAKKAFRTAVAGNGEKLIYALKQNAHRLDEHLMGYMIANAAGDYSPNDVISFMSKPLAIGTQIKVVENSMSLRTDASKKALYAELAAGPAAELLATDAKVRDRYFKVMGAEDLRDKSATHRDRAERENEAFLDMLRLGQDKEGLAKPLVIFEDDDDIHLEEHTDFEVKYFDQMRNDLAYLEEFYTHLETHRLQKEEKEAKIMAGASLQTGAMVAQGAQTPPPNAQQIAQDAQRRQMAAAQNPGQGAAGPQAKPPGQPGAKPQTPGAPASTNRAAQAPA